MKNESIDLGNNETASVGVFEVKEGFLAITYTKSKTFKTKKAAEKWLEKNGG